MNKKLIHIILGIFICTIIILVFFKSRHTGLDSTEITPPQTKEPEISSNSPPSEQPSALPKSSDETVSRKVASKDSDNQTKNTTDFEQNFIAKYSPGWIFQKTKSGKVFRIMGGAIKASNGQPQNTEKAVEEAVERISEDLASFANITGQSFNYKSKKDTNLSDTHFISQSFKGFEVYDGWVRTTANKKGDVFIIENFIKDVDKNLSTEILVSQDKALQIVASEYPNDPEIKKISKTPKIWAEGSHHELVWEFSVFVKGPNLATYKVVVGAESGTIKEQFKTSKN